MAASFLLLFWAVIINCSSLAEDPLDLEKHLCAKAGSNPADGFKMITTDLIQIEPFKLANKRTNTIHGLLLNPQDEKVSVTVVDSKNCMIETIFIETLKCDAAKTSQIQHPECDDTTSHCTPLRCTITTGRVMHLPDARHFTIDLSAYKTYKCTQQLGWKVYFVGVRFLLNQTDPYGERCVDKNTTRTFYASGNGGGDENGKKIKAVLALFNIVLTLIYVFYPRTAPLRRHRPIDNLSGPWPIE